MTRYLPILLVCCIVGALVHAAPPPHADREQRFVEARIAFDEGRFQDAFDLYEGIRQEGVVAPQLYFNLANTQVRLGQLGQAVLNYRRALTLRPRDPDARANLRFTLDITRGIAPEYPAFIRLFRQLNLAEWSTCAIVTLWLTIGLLAVQRLRVRRPSWLLQVATATALATLVAGAGCLVEWSFHRRPEIVITARDVQSRFAPLAEATPHMKLPAGSTVRLVERSADWWKVAAGGNTGWIPANVGEPVLPLREMWSGPTGHATVGP